MESKENTSDWEIKSIIISNTEKGAGESLSL